MSIMNRLHRAVERWAIDAGHTRARQHLLGRGDRFLADNGFSRELLEQGNRAWPWRIDAPVASIPLPARRTPVTRDVVEAEIALPSGKSVAAAVAELDAMSDAELHDLGVARANLVDAVRRGRPGLDREAA